jgi:hypothetical protein
MRRSKAGGQIQTAPSGFGDTGVDGNARKTGHRGGPAKVAIAIGERRRTPPAIAGKWGNRTARRRKRNGDDSPVPTAKASRGGTKEVNGRLAKSLMPPRGSNFFL